MADPTTEECHDIVAHGGTVEDALDHARSEAEARATKGRKGQGKARATPRWTRDQSLSEDHPNYAAALKEARKRGRPSARAAVRALVVMDEGVGHMWADPQFVDALVECSHLDLATRRALHGASPTLRRKMREFFDRPELVLRNADCTNANAAFLFGAWIADNLARNMPGPLLCWNPTVVLRFEPPAGCNEGAIPSVAIAEWMAKHHLAPGDQDRQGEKTFRVPEGGLSEVAAFFLGRAFATLTEGMFQLVDTTKTWEEQPALGDRSATRVQLASLRYHRVPIGSPQTHRMLSTELQFLAGAYYANARRWLYAAEKVHYNGCERLFILDLAWIRLDEAGTEALARALRPDPPEPKPLGVPKRTPPKGKQLLKPEGKGMLKLSLSHTWNPSVRRPSDKGRGLFGPIMRGEVATDRLRELDLSHNRMGVHGLRALHTACTTRAFKAPALRRLSLRDVDLSHDAMFHLAPLVDEGHTLRNLELLDLGENPFVDGSLHEFHARSRGMPNLAALKLDGCTGLTAQRLQHLAIELKITHVWPKIRKLTLCSAQHPFVEDNFRKANLMMRAAVACVKAQVIWTRTQNLPPSQCMPSDASDSSDEDEEEEDSYMSG